MSYYNYPKSYYPHKAIEINSKEAYLSLKNSNYLSEPKKGYSRSNEKAEFSEQKVSPDEFKLVFPYINNLSEDTRKKANTAIIDKETNLLKNNVLSASPIDFKTITSNYSVPLNQKGLLSILFELYYYTGGAHGNTVFDSITIDLNSGEEYKLTDLFNPKLNYIPLLNEIAIKKAKESGVPLLNEYKGLTEDQRFYLSPNYLVLYYQLYEYTPYAYGRFEVKIPYTEIQNLIYPLSPIQKLL